MCRRLRFKRGIKKARNIGGFRHVCGAIVTSVVHKERSDFAKSWEAYSWYREGATLTQQEVTPIHARHGKRRLHRTSSTPVPRIPCHSLKHRVSPTPGAACMWLVYLGTLPPNSSHFAGHERAISTPNPLLLPPCTFSHGGLRKKNYNWPLAAGKWCCYW